MPLKVLVVAVAAAIPALVVATPLAAATHRPAEARTSITVAHQFVKAANYRDYATVCHLYSHRYLKVSQASCRSLYLHGESIFGRFDYRVVHQRRLDSGNWRIDLTRWQKPSFIELAREPAGWRIVAGGW